MRAASNPLSRTIVVAAPHDRRLREGREKTPLVMRNSGDKSRAEAVHERGTSNATTSPRRKKTRAETWVG
jgi:hypothetical protein